MKWVWVHSMRFQRRGAEVFSEAQVAYRTWQRYLAHCDSLHVVGRGPEAEPALQAKYIKPCGGPGVTFTLVDGINSPREMLTNTDRVRRQLEDVISQADGVIARLPSEHGLMAVAVARRWRVLLPPPPARTGHCRRNHRVRPAFSSRWR